MAAYLPEYFLNYSSGYSCFLHNVSSLMVVWQNRNWHSPGFSVRYFFGREGLGQDQWEGERGDWFEAWGGRGGGGDVTRVERVDRVEELGTGHWLPTLSKLGQKYHRGILHGGISWKKLNQDLFEPTRKTTDLFILWLYCFVDIYRVILNCCFCYIAKYCESSLPRTLFYIFIPSPGAHLPAIFLKLKKS
jgi:hypothetical protein